MTRITFIGAGSVEFTRNLLGDILTFPELADAEIVLHDISAERLATAEAMARWTNDAVGARARIEAHLDRRRALEGADFAINTIEVGGIAATRRDFDIPRKYGLRQTIADTSGRGRRVPRSAYHPRDAWHRGRHGRAVPRRPDAQLHQPDGDELLGLVRALAPGPHRRPLPLHPEHEPSDRRVRRRAAGGDHLPRRRREPHELGAARRARRPESVPGAGRGHRGRPRRASAATSASRSTSASATSPPSRASTSPSTCRGSCATTRRSSGCASRWTSTSAAARRTWTSTTRRCGCWPPASPSSSSAARNTPRSSSIPWSPASRGPCTATCATRASSPTCPRGPASRYPASSTAPACSPPSSATLPAAVRGARPHLPQRRRAHRARGPRRRPRHILQAVLLDPNAAATLSLAQMRDLVEELRAAHGGGLRAGAAAMTGDRPLDLLVVGDANPDVVLSGVPDAIAYAQVEQLVDTGTLTVGGSAAILACAAARLGLRTALVSVRRRRRRRALHAGPAAPARRGRVGRAHRRGPRHRADRTPCHGRAGRPRDADLPRLHDGARRRRWSRGSCCSRHGTST